MTTQTREAWLEERRGGIGGSDCAVVCGVSPWKSAYELYLEKRGEGPEQEDNESMYWGRALEPVVRQRYADEMGLTVTVPTAIMWHHEYPWMYCNPDGLTAERMVEIKTARFPAGWGEPGTDEIPEYYVLQCQHNMIVTGHPVADVPVLIGGSDFRIYEVQADPELQALIIRRESEFWEKVLAGEPPEPTTYKDMQLRFGKYSEPVTVQANEDAKGALFILKGVKEKEKELKALKEVNQAIVMGCMGAAEALLEGDATVCTWKLDRPGKRFVVETLKKKHPEIYAECMEDKKPTRRFLPK